MNLPTLIIGLAVCALALTGIQKATDRKLIKNFLLSLLQNFVGGLFVFSGLVKAVDPLGTAYKMEQYFAEFETTFAGCIESPVTESQHHVCGTGSCLLAASVAR